MATVTLIPATTAGATANLTACNYPQYTIMATNIAGAETCDVGILSPDGVTVTPLAWDGRANAIDATNQAVTVPGGPTYVITLSATATASMVSYSPITFHN